MQFPMNAPDRLSLSNIADDLADLRRRASDLGLDYLAVLLSHAREEACERLHDDDAVRRDQQTTLNLTAVSSLPPYAGD